MTGCSTNLAVPTPPVGSAQLPDRQAEALVRRNYSAIWEKTPSNWGLYPL